MKKQRGGKRDGAGRKALPDHLKAEQCGDVRLPKYKKDALRTLTVSLGAAIESALDKEYQELFESFLAQLEKNSR